MAHLDVYLSDSQKSEIQKISKKTGLSCSKLLLKGFNYWLSNNPKELKEEAKIFDSLMEEREAKDLERETGDYLGSFEKHYDKLNRIDKAKRHGDISSEEATRLKNMTQINYEVSQRNKRIRLGMASKEDLFLQKHGCVRNKNGKINKIKKKK